MDDSYTTDYMLRREINEKYMLQKKDVPCQDCGLRWHPAVLTFDHAGRKHKYVNGSGKRVSPSLMKTYNPPDFKNMLDACHVVCANCHRMRELQRDNVVTSEKWKPWLEGIKKGALLKNYKEIEL